MDKSELASLLAATMHSPGTRSPYPSHGTSPHRNPSLSPDREFPSRVQRREHNHRTQFRTVGVHNSRRQHGPQHVSAPRVQFDQNRPTMSHFNVQASHTQQKAGAEGKQTKIGAEVDNEPDFVIEERQAWSRRSPKTAPHRAERYYADKEVSETVSPKPIKCVPGLTPVLKSRQAMPTLHMEHEQQVPHVRTFGPLSSVSDIEERPKTSRGRKVALSVEVNGIQDQDHDDNDASAEAVNLQSRRSRFLEGSMTEKSKAVASAWNENSLLVVDSNSSTLVDTSSADTDSDATPQALRVNRATVSSDHDGLKAPPTTPFTVKRGIFRFGNANPRASEESDRSPDEKPKKSKKGLRKSLSTWNFHNLGDKIKRFGSSTNDLTPKALAPMPTDSFATAVDTALLEERKRKGDEAHARQFGSKRRKSNSNIPEAAPVPQPDAAAPKPSSMKRRTLSSSHSYSSLSTSARSRRASSGSQSLVSERTSSSSDIDARKRPSRSDLEKENQQLRAMLRNSRSMNFDAQAQASRSSVHLPLEQERDPLGNGTRNQQENLAQGNRVSMAPGTKMGRRGEVIPPVPKIPRSVLGGLENGTVNNASLGPTRGIMPEGMAILPRPVSSILELDESETDCEYVKHGLDKQVSTGQTWEWPDDVF